MKYRAIKSIIVTAILISALGATAVSATVSIDIPNVGCLVGDATQCPATVEKGNISQAIVRIYQFAVAIAGILAVGMIVAGSVYYSASAGSPDRQSEGKDMITSALWGIVLLFGSYLILNTVNPRLTALEQPYAPAAVPCQYDNEKKLIKQYDAQGNLLPCLPPKFSYQDILIPGETAAVPVDATSTLPVNDRTIANNSYCQSFESPILDAKRYKECMTRSDRTNLESLSNMINVKAGQCRWQLNHSSNCSVKSKTNAALLRLNTAIDSFEGIKVGEAGWVGRDIKMKWQVTEVFPPAVPHLEQGHYNGCSVDGLVSIDGRKSLVASDCQYLKQFFTAADKAGFHVTNEYYRHCDGKKYKTTTGESFHLQTKNCP